MNRRWSASLLAALAIGAGLEHSSFAQTPAESPPEKAEEPAASSDLEVDGKDISNLSTIEEASLEGLLNLSLEDQLGNTEAVSRTTESILRAPATMTVLDAAQIRRSGATTLAEVLRSIPGVAVFRSTPGNYVVSLRGTGGLAGNNIILLVDGIPLNNPLDGTVSWDLVPLDVEDIERVEVVRGPVSPSYGANAYTGVINVLTRTTLGLSPSYAVRARGGTDFDGGFVGAASGRALHVGDRLQLRLFAHGEHDGLAAASAFDATPSVDPIAGQRLALFGALTYKTGAQSALSAEAGQVWGERNGMDHLALDPQRQAQQLLFGRVAYTLQQPLSGLDELKVWGRVISVDIDADAGAGFSYDGARSRSGVLGSDAIIPLGSWLNVLIGGQLSLEQIEAPFLNPQSSGRVRGAYGFYGGLKASPWPTLDVVLTGRGDLEPISVDLNLSYRASAIYHTDTWGLRLTAASAFRTPTYVEATARFVEPATGLILLEGTDTIGAPRHASLELGANFLPRSTLIITPTIFLSRLSNLMIEDFESVLRRTFRNDPDSRIYLGAEVEASWKLSDAVTILPAFTWLEWLDASERIDTNIAVPNQNSRYIFALRLHGLLGNDRWAYGITTNVAGGRSYNVRTGIPPTVLTTSVPTLARVTGMIEHQLWSRPSVWTSLRAGMSSPSDVPESPLPFAAPLGYSLILGLEMRRD